MTMKVHVAIKKVGAEVFDEEWFESDGPPHVLVIMVTMPGLNRQFTV